jgi:phenylacetate-CoA ligase
MGGQAVVAQDQRVETRKQHSRHPMKQGIRSSAALRLADGARFAALHNPHAFRATATAGGTAAERLSISAAARAAARAIDRVPAYRDFAGTRDRASRRDAAAFVASLPVSDKHSYIDRYPTAERCTDGRIPVIGTQLDESSGSSGVPYTWVRSEAELHEMHLGLSRLATHLFGDDLVTLNGFSMGAWATGTNASAALARNGMVKSTGPDPAKILSALDLLGPDFTYVVTGYPPFLRQLLAAGDEAGFDWRRYRMYGVVGGEGMSEALRARLEQRFIAVYSAYGASDLDIGVACEMPLSVRIRQHAASNPDFAKALFGDDRRLPMLFQYNPLDYFVETNDASELIVTVNRMRVLSPRIRYNIHDTGGTIGFATMRAICRDFGLDIDELARDADGRPPLRLPFLFVHGRSDSTLSYMGANIYPEDVEQGLFTDSVADADRLGAFCLELIELAGGQARPCVHVEVDDPRDDALAARLQEQVRQRLVANSADYRTSIAEVLDGGIVVRLHRPGAGPFAENRDRIKRRYVVHHEQVRA